MVFKAVAAINSFIEFTGVSRVNNAASANTALVA